MAAPLASSKQARTRTWRGMWRGGCVVTRGRWRPERRTQLCGDGVRVFVYVYVFVFVFVYVYVYVQRAESSRQPHQKVTDGLLRSTFSGRRQSNPPVSSSRFSKGVTALCTAHTHNCGDCSACWVKPVQRLFDRSPHGKRLCVFELKFVRQQLACSRRHRYITPFSSLLLSREARRGEARRVEANQHRGGSMPTIERALQ